MPKTPVLKKTLADQRHSVEQTQKGGLKARWVTYTHYQFRKAQFSVWILGDCVVVFLFIYLFQPFDRVCVASWVLGWVLGSQIITLTGAHF